MSTSSLSLSFHSPVARFTGEGSLSSNINFSSQTSPFVCDGHIYGGTLSSVDLNVPQIPHPTFSDIVYDAPLFELDFGFEDFPTYLNQAHAENDRFPSGFGSGLQPSIMKMSPAASPIEGCSFGKNTTRNSRTKPSLKPIRKQSPKQTKSSGTNRIHCPSPNCLSTFARRADLIRHQRSLHSPKTPCIYSSTGCSYATGRSDKMNEHVRKRHHSKPEVKHSGFLKSEMPSISREAWRMVTRTCGWSDYAWNDINFEAANLSTGF